MIGKEMNSAVKKATLIWREEGFMEGGEDHPAALLAQNISKRLLQEQIDDIGDMLWPSLPKGRGPDIR